MGWILEQLQNGLGAFCVWLLQSLFGFLTPFVAYILGAWIIGCYIIYFCTKDKKMASDGFKSFLIYVLFFLLRGAIFKL